MAAKKKSRRAPGGIRLNKAKFALRHAERHGLTRTVRGGGGEQVPDSAAGEGEIMRVLDSIVRETVARNEIAVTGFGVITPVIRPARNARNPQTGEIVLAPQRLDIRLTIGENYRMLLNKKRRLPRAGVNAVSKAPKGSAQSVATLRRRASRAAAKK